MKLPHFLMGCLVVFGLHSALYAQERIISIGGDVTEIIYALGAEQNLVGRDSTSIVPEKAHSLPDVGYMRQLNSEGILALKPSRVISTQVAQPAVVFEQLKSVGVVVDFVPLEYNWQSVISKIERVGELVGKPQQATLLAEKFRHEITSIPHSPLDVRILFLVNRAGINQMAAGSGTVPDSAIKMIGAQNAMGNAVRFSQISQEGIIAANPDLIVSTHSGIETLGSLDKLWELPGIAHTNAGKQKRVVLVDDIAFLAFGLTLPAELQKIRVAAEQAAKDKVAAQ